LDAPGTLHHVIIRGIERCRIVDDDLDREGFVSRMAELAQETGTAVFAWSLMTNHAHILLRSSPVGLATYMRRLLSSYAGYYNRRHSRHGHLFQNRYKSIVCEEDAYFMELVRYIHLNPLRAGLVDCYSKLERYEWCGHSVVLGGRDRQWQDRIYVLRWFGSSEAEAVTAYREFVGKGIEQGHRPNLVGGGLVRSLGGWSAVKSKRSRGVKERGDERILGSGAFVSGLLDQAEKTVRRQIWTNESEQQVAELISRICDVHQVHAKVLRAGSRRKPVSEARAVIAVRMVEELGISLAETARQLGITTPAVALILKRRIKLMK
jgi:REP element-mobilizing transposase RayT